MAPKTTIAQYTKKPVEVSAAQWDGTVESATTIIDWVLQGKGTARYHEAVEAHDEVDSDSRTITPVPASDAFIAINTLEGTMRAGATDWIVRGVAGEHYPVKHDIFKRTYSKVMF